MWVWLLNRNIYLFHIKGNHKWKDLVLSTIIASKFKISPKGSKLAVSLWKARFRVQGRIKLSPNTKDLAGLHELDSIWWPSLVIPQVEGQDVEEAFKMHKMGTKISENI